MAMMMAIVIIANSNSSGIDNTAAEQAEKLARARA